MTSTRVWLVPALLGSLLGACSAPADMPHLRSVVTLGDSVPAGTACACVPFPQLYAQAQHASDVNLAQPGATVANLRVTVPASRDVLASATEVIIMAGANDVAASFDDPSQYPAIAAAVQSQMAATVTAIEQIHPVPVIVLGYWNVVLDGRVGATTYAPAEVRAAAGATTAINNALKAAATEAGASYIATYPAFHGPTGAQDPTALLAPDGDHPNAAGHAAIAALLPPLP